MVKTHLYYIYVCSCGLNLINRMIGVVFQKAYIELVVYDQTKD